MPLKFDAEVGLNAAGFHRGMEGISSTLKNYALGAVGVYSIERAFDKTLETVKELVNESKRMGVTVEQVQVLKKASEEAGVEVGVLSKAMEKLNEFRAKALGGGADSAKALRTGRQLGISRDMLQGQNAQDIIFGAIRQKILSVNPQQIADPLKQVLGKGFGEAIPVITKDIVALQARMEKFGMLISGKTAFELESFEKSIHSLQNILISKLAPALAAFGVGLLTFWKTKADPALKGVAKAFSTATPEGSKGVAGFLKGAAIATWDSVKADLGSRADKDAYNAKYSDAIGTRETAAKEGADEIKDWLKEIENEAKPKKPDFTTEIDAHAGGRRAPEDSLVKVGNFLGSSRGAIGTAQARLEQHAANTATNTKRLVDQTDEMIQALNSAIGAGGGVGILWPS